MHASIIHPDIEGVEKQDDGSFVISGKEGMRFMAKDVVYGEESDGQEDWSIGAETAAALPTENPCDAFANAAGSYLPIQTDKAYVCDTAKTTDGHIAVVLVGFGARYEGTDYLASTIIVPQEDHASVFWSVSSFAAFRSQAEEILQAFVLTHPTAILQPATDPDVLALYDRITQLVTDELVPPSVDVMAGVEHLKEIAATITLED